jgi:hypothetical protein
MADKTETKAPKAKAKVELTPSQYALEKVGEAPETEDPVALGKHGEKYQAAKLARRHGHE